MSRPGWPRTWIRVARQVAARSLCVNSQVAAVVVSADNAFQWVGYNGPPRGFPTGDKTCSHWCPRAMGAGSGTADYSACESLHAEENVLLKADPSLRTGGAIYITRAPCINCARKIANSGLAMVAFEVVPEDDDPARTERTVKYLKKCGLAVLRLYPENDPRGEEMAV